MSTLIVQLPALPVVGASSDFDYALTHDGASVHSHGSVQAALLPAPTGAGATVVAVLPAEKISWHRVELPKGVSARSTRLRAVLEGLLEDQLLDEPEALHFALQPAARSGAPIWVAVCDRLWLRAALQVLEQAQRAPARIVPEFTPEGAPTLYAQGDPQHPTLALAGELGVIKLPLTGSALTLLPALPADALCMAEPAVAQLAEQLLSRQPVLRQAPQQMLQAAQSAWDLSQFEFSSTGRARALRQLAGGWADLLGAPAWRPARWALVLLLLVNLLGLNAWAWRERTAIEDKRQSLHRTLTQTFPHVKVVLDPVLQMEREVAALRQASGMASGRDLEALLGALSSAVPAQRALQAIEYSGTELRVKGLALGADEARSVGTALQSQGYAARLQGDTLSITAEGRP